MTVRIANTELRIVALVAALVVPLIVSGCTPTPEPYFGWDTKSAPRKVVAKPKPRLRYTDSRYADNRYDPQAQNNRQRPKWYDQPADRNDDYANRDDASSRDTYNARDSYNDRDSYNNRDSYDRTARFQWPVRGRVVSEFGSFGGGERNNGINIAAAEREPIRAAADGSVSYAGNELRNYGNLVLIKHDNGYVTAYAHADEFVVAKGQWVAKGQVIGYVGMTGDVRTPQLHFELRRGSHGETPIDPRPMLGSMQVANR